MRRFSFGEQLNMGLTVLVLAAMGHGWRQQVLTFIGILLMTTAWRAKGAPGDREVT